MEELFRELRDSGSKNYDAIVAFSLYCAGQIQVQAKVLNLSAEEKAIYMKIVNLKMKDEIVTDEGFEKFKNRA